MKMLLRSAILVLVLLAPAVAFAACGAGGGDCYGRATGNWSTPGTWSDTDGGGASAAGPAAGDKIHFTANSNAKTFIIDVGTFSIDSLDCTGSSTATLSGNQSVTVTGTTWQLCTTMTYTPSSSSAIWVFAPADGATLSATLGAGGAANNKYGAITINASGASKTGIVQFQDAVNVTASTSSTIVLTAGTLDTNGKAVTAPTFSSTGTAVRKIMGNSAWTLTGTSFWTTSGSNLDATIGIASLTSTGTASGRTFAGGGITFPNLIFNSTGAYASITGANTFTTLNIVGPNMVLFPASTTNTITNAPVWTTSASAPVLLQSGNIGSGAATIAFPANTTLDWVGFQSITCTGSPVSNNSFLFSNDTNCGVTGPAGGGGRIIGG